MHGISGCFKVGGGQGFVNAREDGKGKRKADHQPAVVEPLPGPSLLVLHVDMAAVLRRNCSRPVRSARSIRVVVWRAPLGEVPLGLDVADRDCEHERTADGQADHYWSKC